MADYTRFKLRGDVKADWLNANPVLALNEPALETDTKRFKIGDGVSTYSALPYGRNTNEYASLYNVSMLFPLPSGFYTHATAIAAIPTAERIKGLIISYETAAGSWYTEQYIGSDVSGWATSANWSKVPGASDFTEMEAEIASVRSDLSEKTTIKTLQSGSITRGNIRLISNFQYATDVNYDVIAIPVIAGQKIKVVGQVDNIAKGIFSTDASIIDSGHYVGGIYSSDLVDTVVDISVEIDVPVGATFARLSKKKTLPMELYTVVDIAELSNDNSTEIETIKDDLSNTNSSILSINENISTLSQGVVTFVDKITETEIISNNVRNNQRLTTPTFYVADVDYKILGYPVVAGRKLRIVGKVNKPCYFIFSSTFTVGAGGLISTAYNNASAEGVEVNIDTIIDVPAGALFLMTSKANLLDLNIYDYTLDRIASSDGNGNNATFKPDLTDEGLLLLIDKGVINLENKLPQTIYCTCNNININRNYTLALYVDHMFNLQSKVNIKFASTNSDKLPKFYGKISEDGTIFNNGNVKDSTVVNDTLNGDIQNTSISVTKRTILQSATVNTPIRALIIGDSTVNGTGANFPTAVTLSTNPTTFWSYMYKLMKLDKIDNGNTGFDFVSVGRQSARSVNVNGTTKTVWAEGRGGWRVEDYLFHADSADGAPNSYTNYFYDASKVWTNTSLNTITYGAKTGVKFSIQSYLDKYKTLADDGVTRLVVDSTAGTSVTDVNAYDVCTPNVVVLQLCHNGTAVNFELYIDYMIAAIKEEFPDMPIIISLIDATGTYYPELYPDLDNATMLGDTLHTKNYGLIEKHRALHNETNKVYFCENYFIQPTGYGVTTRPVDLAETQSGVLFPFNTETGAGPNYHPSTFAHAAWGYHLLSMIRWILN